MNARLNFGLTNEELDCIKKIFIQHGFNGEVYLFGSRAKGNYKKYSDIDLYLKSRVKMKMGQIFLLKDELMESNLPYRVDIILDDEISTEFRDIIQLQRILLFKL